MIAGSNITTTIKTDTNPVTIEVGSEESDTIISNRNDAASDFVIQGGTYAAKNVNVNLTWLNRGENDPKWYIYGKYEIFRM